MTSRTILQIVAEAATLSGLEEPTAVVSATDITTKQLLAFAQQEGDELSRAHDWRGLKVLYTITGDGTTEFWPLPDDFDRSVFGDALWLDDRPQIPVNGPLSDENFLAIKAANYTPPYKVWRYFGDNWQIYPVLSNGELCKTEYRSTEWILAADLTTGKTRFSVDSDVVKIPDRLIVYGIIWRFKRAKGLDYAEEFATYQLERAKAMRSDGGVRTLVANDFSYDWIKARRNAYRVTT